VDRLKPDAVLSEASLACLQKQGGELELLTELAAVHRNLWALEDQARSRQATAEEITRVKRSIDAFNGRRHELIDRFDASYSAVPVQDRPSSIAPLEVRRFSETAGELCDRLIILSLKIHNAQAQLEDPSLPATAQGRCRTALVRLKHWRSHLSVCLEDLTRALVAGTALLPPRREFKMYNDPVLNPVTRQEGWSVGEHDRAEVQGVEVV